MYTEVHNITRETEVKEKTNVYGLSSVEKVVSCFASSNMMYNDLR